MHQKEPRPEFCPVQFKRLEIAVGDIALSYSVDEISAGRPLRAPFEHAGELWVCTSMTGKNATRSGLSEFEAYRLAPASSFKGAPVTFKTRAGSEEARTEAEDDPNGLYHGVLVTFGRAKSVLCGPPVTFVSDETTRRKKRDDITPQAEPEPAESSDSVDEPCSADTEATSEGASPVEPPTCPVSASRLSDDCGDINESYSADRIASNEPVRRPFKHDGALWVCTSITGSALTASGGPEHEAYRLVPKRMFSGPSSTYSEKTGTAESSDAARNDPNGFYHGMKVQFAAAAFVLCGPPLRFVAAERPEADHSESEPAQLSLF